MKNIKKVAFASTAALLLTSSLVSAQTTVGGNMRIGLKGHSSNGKAASDTIVTKETQINIAGRGNLNFGGGTYAAGFSVEFDGNDNAFDAGQHFEGNYINFIFGNTLLHAGSDWLKPVNVNLAEIVNGSQTFYQTASGIAARSADVVGVRSMTDTVVTGEKGDAKGFGFGIIQTIPGIGTISGKYLPNGINGVAQADTANVANLANAANSQYSVGARINQAVKGLDLHIGYNNQDTQTPGETTVAQDLTTLTYGVKYQMGQIIVGAERTEQQYDSTGRDRNITGFGIGYVVNKDLTVSYGLYRGKDSASTAVDTEKTQGITIGQSLGPVGLTITAAKIDNNLGVVGADGKAVHVQLGVVF